jgi:hypothetical protein
VLCMIVSSISRELFLRCPPLFSGPARHKAGGGVGQRAALARSSYVHPSRVTFQPGLDGWRLARLLIRHECVQESPQLVLRHLGAYHVTISPCTCQADNLPGMTDLFDPQTLPVQDVQLGEVPRDGGEVRRVCTCWGGGDG